MPFLHFGSNRLHVRLVTSRNLKEMLKISLLFEDFLRGFHLRQYKRHPLSDTFLIFKLEFDTCISVICLVFIVLFF